MEQLQHVFKKPAHRERLRQRIELERADLEEVKRKLADAENRPVSSELFKSPLGLKCSKHHDLEDCHERLDLIYRNRLDRDERKFSCAHETILPLCSVARSIFNQLRKSATGKASKRVDSGAASRINGRLDGRINRHAPFTTARLAGAAIWWDIDDNMTALHQT